MKKKVCFILVLLLVLTSVLGLSYASWLFNGKQRNFNTLGSKCFELTMINESAGITLTKAYPISDEEGMKSDGYTFTIKNTCNTYATYEVNLEDMLLEEKRLSGEYIKVSINDGSPINLKELEKKIGHIEGSDKSYELTSGSLAPEEEMTYTIKLWMDEETPAIEEVMNATFLSKVSIEAGYIEEDKLVNGIELEVKSITESLNNIREVFEIKGTSSQYNLIEYSFDNNHWTRIENPAKEVTIIKEIQEAGKQNFYIRDEVGNVKEIEIQTTKLDQTIPEIKIAETDNQENIELNITFKDNLGLGGYAITGSEEEPEEWIVLEGKESVVQYKLTENKTYYIWIKDSVGNTNYQKYSTDTIDTKAPELSIRNTLTEWGVKDILQIEATDDVIGLSGISISKEEGIYNWEVIENTLNYETEKEIIENGIYYITVKDAYGHITTKSIVIDKIDNELPSIESLSAQAEWGTTNEITGTFVDNESGLVGYQITREKEEPTEYIEIDGANFSFTYTATENGVYYIWVKDKVGNLTQTEIEVNKIDNTAPVLSSITNSSNGEWAQSVTLSWDIEETESGIKSVQYGTDNISWIEFLNEEWYGFTSIEEQDTILYIRVVDHAGNISNVESTTIKIDRTAPTAPVITNSQNNVWSKDSVIVSMNSTDSQSGINRYEWYENGGWTTRAITIKDGVGTIKYTAERNETIRIRAVDNAGNVSSESTTIVKIDTTNPTAKISASVKQNSITVSASGSSDTNSGIASYQYSKDNKTWYTSTSSSYTFTGLSDGTYTLYVKVTDNAGRTSSVVSTKAIVKNYTYLYDYGTTNTSLIGNWVIGSGATILGSGWTGSGTVTYNLDNILLEITGYSSYSSSSDRNRVIGIRTNSKVNLTNYSQLCIVHSLNIPTYIYDASGSNTSVGGRLGTTTSTTQWYSSENSGAGNTGYWTRVGQEYNVTKETMCSNVSTLSESRYIYMQYDASLSAYGASLTANIYQIYLIP